MKKQAKERYYTWMKDPHGRRGGFLCRSEEWSREEDYKRESEAHSIFWVLRRPRYDKTNSISLELKRWRRDDVSIYIGIEEVDEGLYSIDGENINGRAFNEGWQRIRENHEPWPNFRD